MIYKRYYKESTLPNLAASIKLHKSRRNDGKNFKQRVCSCACFQMAVNCQFTLFKSKFIMYANLRNTWMQRKRIGGWERWERDLCFPVTEFLFLHLERLGWLRTLAGCWAFMGSVKSLACTDRIHSVFLMAIISQVLIMLCGLSMINLAFEKQE